MGPRASLDGCGKSRPHRDSIPGPPSPKRVTIPTELSRPYVEEEEEEEEEKKKKKKKKKSTSHNSLKGVE